MTKIAIIGTAGRDKSRPMNNLLWTWMVADAMQRIPKGAHVVSGGAAWADHLAVTLLLDGHVNKLTLFLPAPFDGQFIGPQNSSASAANYYHGLFSKAAGIDSLNDLDIVTHDDSTEGSFEPAAPGYLAMFARNAKVAKADEMLAYTFGQSNVPVDGGTKNTWDQCRGKRTHVSLPFFN